MGYRPAHNPDGKDLRQTPEAAPRRSRRASEPSDHLPPTSAPSPTRAAPQSPAAATVSPPPPSSPEIQRWITDLREGGARRVLGVRLNFFNPTGPSSGAIALVCAWHHASDVQRDEAWPLIQPLLSQALDKIVAARHAPDFVGASALISDRCLCQHAPVLTTALELEDHAARASAGRAFMMLARTPDLDIDSRRALLSALVISAERCDAHRVDAVVEAMARCAALWPGVWASVRESAAWLNDESHPASMVIRAHLRRSADPSAAAAAWRWLTTRALRSACVARVTAPLPGDSIAWFLRSSHLLLNPTRARLLKGAPGVHAPAAQRRDRPASMLTPECNVLDRCELASRLGGVRLARFAPLALYQRDSLLAGRLLDDSALVRLAASIAASGSPLPLSCESDYVFDPDSRVSRHSALSMLATTTTRSLEAPARQRLAISLLRSPHASVRDLGAAALARDALTEALLPPPALAATALADGADAARIIEITRTGRAPLRAAELMEFVRQGLDAPDSHAPEANESSPGRPLRALSAAAAALGHVNDIEADALLRRLLTDADARVRSNAVEAIARRARRALPGSQHTPMTAPLLIGLLGDEHHRVAGSAARAMIQLGRATRQSALLEHGQRAVLSLMADHRPLRKRAGLWAATNSAGQLPDVAEFLDAAQRARRDADETVSASANHASERLMGELRRRWALRAPSMTA